MAAAMSLADGQGLVAVSLRNVGAELGAGPMRLYGYVATKEELLELMVDAVWGEIGAPPHGAWRGVLRHLATSVRAASHRHAWFVGLLGGRPQIGPNVLAHREGAFAALAENPGFESIDFVMQAYRTTLSYVIGALQSEQHELSASRESGLEKSEWQQTMWPYIERTLASGRFPMLARIVHEATHPPAEALFVEGLEVVMDGIAARLRSKGPTVIE